MNRNEARVILAGSEVSRTEFVSILQYLGRAVMKGDIHSAREVALRCLARQEHLDADLLAVLRDQLRLLGFYPYLQGFDLPSRAAVDFEFHRAEGIPDVVLHSEQFRVANHLASGESVILSAPTSFGKSLLIEDLVASKRYRNIAIIQPTLALIDETRARLRRYTEFYKLIFTTSQTLGDANLLILTPERFLELSQVPPLDFFVIDEFYKLSLDRDDERANVLNHAFYVLLKHTRRFYLLGPRVAAIPQAFEIDYDCKFVKSSFETVASDVEVFEWISDEQRFEILVTLLERLPEPTLIYCQSPPKAEKYAQKLLSNHRQLQPVANHQDVVSWISRNLHPDWSLSRCLQRGVGYHHGRLPRHLARYLVRAFNEGTIRYLFCTSTLIEGVNTVAKNVVILDSKKGSKKIDFFDFSNISGRSGRMGTYLVGRVFVFMEPPSAKELKVDFPWYTQDKAPDEVLVQLDEGDLKQRSKERLSPFFEHPLLDLQTIRKNSNITPSGQIRLAEYIDEHLSVAHRHLSWTGFPTWGELEYTCRLIWDFLVVKKGKQAGVSSGRSLAYVINRYRSFRTPGPIIRDLMNRTGCSADEAIQECMEQIRVWCEFKFPKLLLALDAIQRKVFSHAGLVSGSYQFFASQVENGFLHHNLAALQEFGIPVQLALKLEAALEDLSDLDKVLTQLRRLNYDKLGLDPFEKRILRDI